MSTATLSETQIKDLFKQAMVELLQERQDLFSDLFAQVLEDLALIRAIQEGEVSKSVSREAVFQVLEAAT